MSLNTGNKDQAHHILTVGDRPGQACDLGPVLADMKINCTQVKTGGQGIKAMEKSPSPFPLVICDQRLTDMKGTSLLARVKKISPDTIRFLITGYSDMGTIISAVNKGAVHRYISSPWTEEQIIKAVRWGVTRREARRESDRLFALAKKQNEELFELNCRLMEATTHLDKESKSLEENISTITAQLKLIKTGRPLNPGKMISRIIEEIKASDIDQTEHLKALYAQIIFGLHETFNNLALRNGLEMTEPGSGPGESNA